jgi:hypothetical protein
MADGLIALFALVAVVGLYRLLALGAPSTDDELADPSVGPISAVDGSRRDGSRRDIDAAA